MLGEAALPRPWGRGARQTAAVPPPGSASWSVSAGRWSVPGPGETTALLSGSSSQEPPAGLFPGCGPAPWPRPLPLAAPTAASLTMACPACRSLPLIPQALEGCTVLLHLATQSVVLGACEKCRLLGLTARYLHSNHSQGDGHARWPVRNLI